ncbi:MAG: peptidylprolyl isomerase [Acidovorax sp.]|uniref:peptidylprolyl isomerase n=1 Tax=Acidovorax sp. TaxID=1872122 RepID=UPI00262B7DA7|nr:peptidylprolyl isomerase [Acidovorax sp.]MDH4426152.1 peptidylprolyl isomerase [Acidovorax sp.]
MKNKSVCRFTFSLSCYVLGSAMLWVGLSAPVAAADDSQILLRGPGIAITADMARTELLALPRDVRTKLLGNATELQEWLDTVYLRKALAAEAEKNKLDRKSAVSYQLQSARESILANAQLVEAEDLALPRKEALEAQARAEYTADKETYNRPAQTRASHILIRGDDDAARAKAQQLLEQLQAGASFEELARKNSADPGSAARGGSLGWFEPSRMVPEFAAALAKLQKPEELSPLVKSSFGFHIIRLDGRRDAQKQPFDEVREQLIAGLIQKARVNTREAEFKRVGDAAQGNSTALESFLSKERSRNETPAAAPTATTKP